MSLYERKCQPRREANSVSGTPSGIWLVSISALGHFTVDGYGNFLPPLLPLLAPKLGLSLVAVGGLASILGVSTSLIQPLFGLWADRMGSRWMVVGSVLVASVFFSLIGRAPTYATLALMLAVGGIGVAAFHPLGAVMAGVALDGRRGLGMSVFTTCGTAGLALSPMVVAFVAARWGLANVFWMAIPGVLMSILFLKYLPQTAGVMHRTGLRGVCSELLGQAKPLAFLVAVVAVRATVSMGLVMFLPLWLRSQNVSTLVIGSSLSLFLFCGALGGLLGGHLSDRLGRPTVLLISLLGPAPLLFVLPDLHGLWHLLALSLVGFALLSSVPVNVVMAQELAPRGAATVSSLAMGFGWGLGGILLTPFGAASDALGLQWSLRILACLPLFGALCVPLITRRSAQGTDPAERATS